MGRYSIKELEKLSGVKAHTIRIWEKRHQIITPQRTTTNIRYYSDEDLKRIINVSVLNQHGVKISKVARMSVEEINNGILDISRSKSTPGIFVDQLTVAMIDMDEESFEKTLSELINNVGFEKCMMDVVYPFLEKIGVLWQTGGINPAQEHFMSNLIRQKIITSIAALPKPRKSTKVVLFLPEGELHELGLLYYNYIIRRRGFKTYYLGQSVPYNDLKKVCDIHQPDILVTSFISSTAGWKLHEYIETLSEDFSESTILISGLMVSKTAFSIPKNIKAFYKANELPAILESM
ncbi:MAG TPA: MerR family transcriptional regulator [Cyclobacteriaceae bacterium]